MNDSTNPSITYKALTACVMTAIICSATFMTIPIPGSPIPLTLQNMLILLTALLLEPFYATLSVAMFIILGALGLPVFTGFKGGFAHLMNKSGGYILGYLIATIVVSYIVHLAKKDKKIMQYVLDICASILFIIIVYFFGVIRLKYILNSDINTVILLGAVPYIIPDLLKAACAILLVHNLRPILSKIENLRKKS